MTAPAAQGTSTARVVSGALQGGVSGGSASFLGVPYGGSAAGANRFKPPTPPASWTGVRAATSWGPRSFQTRLTSPFAARFPATQAAMAGDDRELDVEMSEDCLTLNVWTPVGFNEGDTRPVLVWLHGGGSCGSPSENRADGAALASLGDVVVVSVTHRLNVFGYLYLGHVAGDAYRDSGCVGLLDIVAALEWVRDNVATFGGNPENVTLFGESAGGAKIACLLAMESARGLFHKAAIMSGAETTTGMSASLADAESFTDEYLRELGLSPADWSAIEHLPAAELVRAHEAVSNRLGTAYVLPPPGPTIDGVTLTKTPIELMEAGLLPDVPLIVGACRDEGLPFTLREDVLATGTERRVTAEETIPAALGTRGRDDLEAWLGPQADRIIDAYTSNRPGSEFPAIESAIRGDRQFLLPSLRFAEARLRSGAAPVFVYSLDWRSDFLPQLGAFHSMDIRFFFSTTDHAPVTARDQSSSKLAARMSHALVAFARNGNPDHTELPPWPPYDLTTRPTMIFDRTCRVAADPRAPERAAWDPVPAPDLGF